MYVCVKQEFSGISLYVRMGHFMWIVSGGSGACMCVLTLHSESLHCSCQVESFFRVKEFPPPPVLVTSSGNDADGFRGICTLGGWTRLQHLYGPRIWVPRRVSLVDRWPCRADPSQVCGWHDKQQSGSHGDSWISDKVGKCSLRKIPWESVGQSQVFLALLWHSW